MRIACWIRKAKYTHSEYAILNVFHCNNGCTKAPQYCVIRTLSVLLTDAVLFVLIDTVRVTLITVYFNEQTHVGVVGMVLCTFLYQHPHIYIRK